MRRDSWPPQLYPFSSQKKRMSTIVRLPSGKFRLFVKGAPELLLPLCSSIQTNAGTEPLSAQDRVCVRAAQQCRSALP